jgi:para-nitrobenzyl esterase
MPTLHLAEAAQAGGSAVWLSELCWGFGPRGAAHTLDALLVFGTADIDGEMSRADPAAAERARAIADVMRSEYLAFAVSGDPGWPPFEPRERATRVYDVEPSVRPYPEQRSAALWRRHRFAATGPAG